MSEGTYMALGRVIDNGINAPLQQTSQMTIVDA